MNQLVLPELAHKLLTMLQPEKTKKIYWTVFLFLFTGNFFKLKYKKVQ